MLARRLTARAPQMSISSADREIFPASPFWGREAVLEKGLTCPFRGRETVSRLSYYAIHAATASCSLSGRVMHFQFWQYFDLAHCNCSSQNEINRTSLMTVISTYRKWMWPFAHGAQRRCHQSRRHNNTIGARMECTRHTVMFRKYRRTAEHPSFYALTSLFPCISRYKWSHTRAAKKHSDSNDDLIFSPSHFHSVK